MDDTVKLDCRFFLGDRPCVQGGPCAGCGHYSPMGARILVIKLAAAGDVLRATSVLPPLKRKYPDSHVTWVADAGALPLVEGNPYVDRALPMTFESWLVVSRESFDVGLCLDKEPRAAALLASVDAASRIGFGLSRWGTIEPLNEGARYDFALGLSNEMKFRENEKTCPEIFCEIAELPYAGDPYSLFLSEDSVRRARAWLETLGPSEPLVGLNVGAGGVFANKAWTARGYAELARRIAGELGGTAVVLGGPDDREKALAVLELAGGSAVDGGTHPLLDFAGLVGLMDAVVTGDTLAMHVAIALEVPVVVLLGPTVPQEIAVYGAGRILVSDADCAPCYARRCDVTPSCMELIGSDDVVRALREVLTQQ
ncbi:MAG: glycosyltransferase family 9 protein [Candidatus Eisenbacteria bacterium]